MTMTELANMFSKSSLDQFPPCDEEDPLRDNSDVAGREIVKSTAGLPCVHFGSWRRNLAAFTAIGTAIVVAFAIVQGSTAWFDLKHIEKHPSSRPQSKWMQRKQKIVVIPSCNYDEEGACPALDLFHNPEVHEVATENLIKISHGFLTPADRSIVKSAVAAGFKNISFEIQMRVPKVAKALRMLELSRVQKNAVLNAMRLMSNPQVQSIGRDIGQAIHDSKSTDRENLKRNIRATLQQRLPEIMKLSSELIPESLRQAWRGAHQWTLALDEENIHVMRPYKGEGKHGVIKNSTNSSVLHSEMTPFLMTTYSILGGVLEEGRALLDIVELCGRLSGKHLDVPYWITYLGSNMEVTSEFLSCEHHFGNSTEEDIKLNSISALFCPLKFGTQGMDALKAAFDTDDNGPFIPDKQFALPSLMEEEPVAPPMAPVFRGSTSKPRLRIFGA